MVNLLKEKNEMRMGEKCQFRRKPPEGRRLPK
jgi:hypothetical protein